MATPVTVVPQTLSFGAVPPNSIGPDIGTFGGDLPSFVGGVQVEHVPVDANVSVRITGDTDHFAIRDVFLIELVERFVGGGDPDVPGGGHPHKEKVLEVVGVADGSNPVQVKQGQLFLVRAKYTAGQMDGSFSGTLLIEGDTWEPVSVPLSLTLQLVTASASDTLTIAQGHQASLGVVVQSIIGPAVDVVFEMSPTQLHTGLTLADNVVHLEPRQTTTQTLIFQADRDAPLGTNQVAIQKRPGPGFFVSVNIVSPGITVNPARPNRIRALKRGIRIDIPIVIGLNGGAATSVNFPAPELPPGVSMQPASVFAQAETTTTSLSLFLGDQAPGEFSFSVEWSALGGNQSGRLDFGVTIKPETELWPFGGQTTPATLGGSSQLAVNSDGFWQFTGHVHDSGFFDLFYASLIVLDFHDGTHEARVFQRDGSVTGTGNPFGSRDDDWVVTGRDQFFADNWDLVKQAIGHSRLHASAEFFDVLEVVLAPFLAEIGLVKFLIEQAGEIDIGGGGSKKPPECELIVTNEGVELNCEG
jgi:hypothetical protein